MISFLITLAYHSIPESARQQNVGIHGSVCFWILSYFLSFFTLKSFVCSVIAPTSSSHHPHQPMLQPSNPRSSRQQRRSHASSVNGDTNSYSAARRSPSGDDGGFKSVFGGGEEEKSSVNGGTHPQHQHHLLPFKKPFPQPPSLPTVHFLEAGTSAIYVFGTVQQFTQYNEYIVYSFTIPVPFQICWARPPSPRCARTSRATSLACAPVTTPTPAPSPTSAGSCEPTSAPASAPASRAPPAPSSGSPEASSLCIGEKKNTFFACLVTSDSKKKHQALVL